MQWSMQLLKPKPKDLALYQQVVPLSHIQSTFPAKLHIRENEILSSYTTYGIGGAARYFAIANTIEELIALLEWSKLKQLPIFILGKGSNTVFDDRGFNGLVILIKLRQFHLDEEGRVRVDA